MLTKLKQAHALEPGLVEAKSNLALIVAHLTHNDTKAQQLLMEAQEAEPTNVAVISNLALLVCSSGQLRKADELLIRALALEPAHRCQCLYLCTFVPLICTFVLRQTSFSYARLRGVV